MAKNTARVPLMAGNWKMNLNHQEAVVLVQKLAWTLSDKKHDYAKVEVAVLPPFTDLRSVQTLIDGDRLKLKHGAQDLRCTLEARLAAHPPVVVSHFAENMDEAVRGATQKLLNALDHTFGKLDRHQHRDRETIRRDPDVVGQGNG